MITRHRLIYPDNRAWATEERPAFKWDAYPDAADYTLTIEKLVGYDYVPFLEIKNISDVDYRLTSPLEKNELYRWFVKANLSDGAQADLGINYLVGPIDSKAHKANEGLDFYFKNTMSEEVLHNYLSRGANCFLFDEYGGGLYKFEENLRMLLYTGAKYVQRAICCDCWTLEPERAYHFPRIKACIEKAHMYDPDIIFEGGVYEILNKQVERTKIPAFVFEYFGLPVEERCFVLENMLYLDGHHRNVLGEGNHAPDMSRTETQMWFLYRASLYIDMGFESIHLGSTPSMNDVDKNQDFAGWKRVTELIRKYAKAHARRGMVLLNAHATDMKTQKNELLFDFYAWLICGRIPKGETDGLPTEDHPQRLEIGVDKNPSGIYGKTTGGIHPCGYETNRAMYVVEFDNYGVIAADKDKAKNQPSGMYPWGYEENAWLRRQPDWYRREFLKYAYEEIRKIDGIYGHITMPLWRVGNLYPYRSNLIDFGGDAASTQDEVVAREIFINDKNR